MQVFNSMCTRQTKHWNIKCNQFIFTNIRRKPLQSMASIIVLLSVRNLYQTAAKTKLSNHFDLPNFASLSSWQLLRIYTYTYCTMTYFDDYF